MTIETNLSTMASALVFRLMHGEPFALAFLLERSVPEPLARYVIEWGERNLPASTYAGSFEAAYSTVYQTIVLTGPPWLFVHQDDPHLH